MVPCLGVWVIGWVWGTRVVIMIAAARDYRREIPMSPTVCAFILAPAPCFVHQIAEEEARMKKAKEDEKAGDVRKRKHDESVKGSRDARISSWREFANVKKAKADGPDAKKVPASSSGLWGVGGFDGGEGALVLW